MVPKNFNIKTTSELGPATLGRIDDLNAMLDRGVEIGPETRQTIEALNETIAEGVRLGFTEDTLARVDGLLDLIEQGVGISVGLDPETNATVNRLIDTIDDAPDQWENTMTEIIQTLETSTSNVASDIADEVKDLMDEARVNTQYVTAAVGIEFRCNVDFLGARAGETIDQFIGRTLVGRLRSIISGEKPGEEAPIPWVCQIIPDQIDLEEVGEVIVFQDAVVKISGYNYEQTNLPEAYIVDEAGQRIASALLYPFLTSPYQLQLNLQGIDFSTIPERSRVVFSWPSTGVNYALSVVFPGQEALPTEIPTAKLTINAASVDVLKGPAANYHILGRAEMGAEYVVTGKNGDGSWWQIDYDGNEGWVPNGSVIRNELEVPVVSIPLPPPTANFEMTPSSGKAPLDVTFLDTSTGNPFRWVWEFGEGLPSYDKEVSHQFANAGTYQITLTVENDLGFGSVTKEIVVESPGIVYLPILPPMQMQIFPTPTPAFPGGSVVFTNFVNLNPPVHFNTSIRSDFYDCGIVGMAARSGDIQESGTGNILYANMMPEGDAWWINADFRTHLDSETWSFAVMCVTKNSAAGYQVFRRVHVEPAVRETIDLGDLGIQPGRLCGVIGMAAWSGDINENGQGLYILKAYAAKNSSTGNWELTANFNTHGDHEEAWDLDILCVHDNPAIFRLVKLNLIRGGETRDSGISSSQYACGIVGMAALYGDIQEDDSGNILLAYPFIGGNGNWFVRTDFRTQGDQEQWDIDLLCVNRSSANLSGNWADGWVP